MQLKFNATLQCNLCIVKPYNASVKLTWWIKIVMNNMQQRLQNNNMQAESTNYASFFS